MRANIFCVTIILMAEQHCYEVEVKSLLGSEERANAIRGNLYRIDPKTRLANRSSQLNHYFMGGNLKALLESVVHRCLSEEKCLQFEQIAKTSKNFSVRTRQKDTGVYLVVKASVDDASSHNGTARLEFDEKVVLPLDTLDSLVLGSGFQYQAKWSREREEYLCMGLSVCLDKNAGYGWLAEFEKIVHDQNDIPQARKEIYEFMKEVGAEELSQERLERMFAFYNEHWQEYYGTEKVFTVE